MHSFVSDHIVTSTFHSETRRQSAVVTQRGKNDAQVKNKTFKKQNKKQENVNTGDSENRKKMA